MTILGRTKSKDGFNVDVCDYGGIKEAKRFLLLIVTNSKVRELWQIYVPDSLDYKTVANEIIEELMYGVKKILKHVGERTPVTSLKIKGQIFEAKRSSLDFL